jgi:ATP-dependent DNA ligase
MELPVRPPVAPMLARLARELPRDGDYIYEPKWDGFRCLVFRDGDDVDLRSRNDRPLARYFPEIVAALRALPEQQLVVDGELIAIGPDGRADFAALLGRLHPAGSRVARLATETPARYVAFDLVVRDGTDLRSWPFERRRTALRQVIVPDAWLSITPATSDPATAQAWLDTFAGAGVDGIVAKSTDLTYQPGRRAMMKIKPEHTADCVVAGVRLAPTADSKVASLLLGVYDETELVHVGVCSQFKESDRTALIQQLVPYETSLVGHPWERGFLVEGGAAGRLKGAAGRWVPGMEQDWIPLRPDAVCEVAYDQLDGYRFRHPARFRRWRPDRDAESCTVDQFHEPGADVGGLLAVP